MELKEIITNGGGLALILMTIVQISPIKINPWSWVAQSIGRAINGEVIQKNAEIIKKVDNLAYDFQALKATCDRREAEQCRSRICRFGDEILHGVQHSKEHFDQILLDCTDYETYCDEHPHFSNNVAVQTIELIKRTYRACMEDKTFL